MAEETFVRLFRRMDTMQEHLTRIEVLLDENLLVWKQEVTQRLEQHDKRMRILEKLEQQRKNTKDAYVSIGACIRTAIISAGTAAGLVYTLIQIANS